MFGFRTRKALYLLEQNRWLNSSFPPSSITWKKASKGLWTPFPPPSHCPKCGKSSVITFCDWWAIEDSGQYMVRIHSCPIGHGYSIWIA